LLRFIHKKWTIIFIGKQLVTSNADFTDIAKKRNKRLGLFLNINFFLSVKSLLILLICDK